MNGDALASQTALEVATRLMRQASPLIEAAETTSRLLADIQANLSTALAGFGVAHRWEGSRLDIRGPDGEWVIGSDLGGPPGATNHITMHVHPLPFGYAPEVLPSGESPAQVFDIGMPLGPPGVPGEPLTAMIGDVVDPGPGGWWLTPDYHGSASFNYLRLELLSGEATGVEMELRKNGLIVRDGLMLSSTPTTVTDLAMTLAAGESVSVHRSFGGEITGPWLAAIQIDGRL